MATLGHTLESLVSTLGPVALGDKNFVSLAEFQEKFWFNKFFTPKFLLNVVALRIDNLIFYA